MDSSRHQGDNRDADKPTHGLYKLPMEMFLSTLAPMDIRTVNALGRTSKQFYNAVNPALYERNVKFHNASSLLWSARFGRIATMKHAVAAGAGLDTAYKTGKIFPAIAGEHAELTEMMTALHVAALHGQKAVVEWILDQDVPAEAWSEGLLHCEHPGITSISQVKFGAREMYPWTPLHLAMCHKKVEIAELLIRRGSPLQLTDPNDDDTFGPPLHWAAAHNQFSIFDLIVQHPSFVDINRTDGMTGGTALTFLIEAFERNYEKQMKYVELGHIYGRFAALQGLIGHRFENNEPLDKKLEFDRAEENMILRLIQLGADINHRDLADTSPLYSALDRNWFTAANIFLTHGADIERPNRPNARYTSLALCAKAYSIRLKITSPDARTEEELELELKPLWRCMKLLQECGANVMDELFKSRQRDVVESYITQTNSPVSPMDLAIYKWDTDMVDFFLADDLANPLRPNPYFVACWNFGVRYLKHKLGWSEVYSFLAVLELLIIRGVRVNIMSVITSQSPPNSFIGWLLREDLWNYIKMRKGQPVAHPMKLLLRNGTEKKHHSRRSRRRHPVLHRQRQNPCCQRLLRPLDPLRH